MTDLTDERLRPIIGIENRTAQEVFDMMCARFRATPVSIPQDGTGGGRVTDEMVERAARAMEPMAFREEHTATDEGYDFELEGRAQALGRARAALLAALEPSP